jgi:hypothetical protein
MAAFSVLLAFVCSLSLAQETGAEKEGAPAEVPEKAEGQADGEAEEKKAEDDEKAALREEIEKLKKEVEDLKQEGEKTILLLDGKIKYTVEPTAVMDFEEIVALTEAGDPAFKASMQKGGKEADMALLELLKKLSPDDRRITSAETKAFQKTMRQTASKPEAAPAPETEEPEQPAAEEEAAAPAPEVK